MLRAFNKTKQTVMIARLSLIGKGNESLCVLHFACEVSFNIQAKSEVEAVGINR